MTLNRFQLNRVMSPHKSPKNVSARRRSAIRKINHEVKFGSASKANLKVVVRIRPENEREIMNNQRSVVDIIDDHMLVFDPKPKDDGFFFHGVKQSFRDLNKKQHKQQKFVFENVFGPESTNQEVFENTTKNLIDTILNGYNCSVFAYGATGAGKTYTMLGSGDNHGIAFLTVMELYKKIKDLEKEKICEIGVSYLEVYNELVRDLLQPGLPLNLHEAGQQVKVSCLSLHKPKDETELLEILERGNKNRSQHPTDINAESSRSHAVFQVFVRQQSKEAGVPNVSIAKLSMIDLAGSERGTATGFKGARFREGASINKSLLALGNCINALADGKNHIPYRDSKLTRLLKDSIGGNCRSVMIAAASRASGSFEDTFNTLKYANRAKTIKTTLKKNVLSVDHHVSQYVKIVENLREEILSLNAQMKVYEEKEKEPRTDLNMDERAMYEETIQDLRRQLEEKDIAISQKNTREEILLNSFNDANAVLKARQRELLELESNERLLALKQFYHQNNIAFMNLFLFASKKMGKGISKSQSVINHCKTRLEYIKKRKDFLQTGLASCRANVQEIVQSLNSLSHPNQSSENVQKALMFSNLEMISRDNHQTVQYLQDLLKSLFAEHVETNKLAILLLHAAKSFYLKLAVTDSVNDNCKELFENIVKFLDSSQIEWADQKDTDESMHKEIVEQYVPSVPSLNIGYLTLLPHLQDFSLSPATYEVLPLNRRSIMKSSSSATLPSSSRNFASLMTPIREKSDGIKQSTLSFVSEHASGNLLDNENVVDEAALLEIVALTPPVNKDFTDSNLGRLNETFDLGSPIRIPECSATLPGTGLQENCQLELESSTIKDDLNGTFSITPNVSRTLTVEQTTPHHAAKVLPTTKPNAKTKPKGFSSIFKSTMTPFKVPKIPSKGPLKSSSHLKPTIKKPDTPSLKKSFSVGSLSGGNALRPNTLSKPLGYTPIRKNSACNISKENIPPLRSSVSSSKMSSSRQPEKISTPAHSDLSSARSHKNRTAQEVHHPSNV